jgi:cephalosporin-C deacetylase
MPRFDLPLDQMRTYRPALAAPGDLDQFWQTTLEEARAQGREPVFVPFDTGLRGVESFDVTFTGYGGHPVRAWLHLPAAELRDGTPLPGIVQYQGYGGGRSLAEDDVFWAVAGFAYLIMDTRGQGSGWAVGDTADPVGSAASQPGFLTRGILDRHDYYYRRLYTDAVRAFETLRGHPLVDANRVAVTGRSQGGGLTIAVAALAGEVFAALPDVPFLCDFPRATEICEEDPYGEIVRYLKAHRDHDELAFATLAYFDGAVLAPRAGAPALFSVALMDQICPPSTVYAAYNAYGGTKEIVEYGFNDHEGGGPFQRRRQLQWLRRRLA